MSKTVNVLLGFAGGLAAGAGIGILFAPREGRETRDKLTYRLDKARNHLKKLIEDIRATEEFQNLAQEESHRVTSEVTGKVEMLLNEVEDYIQKIQTNNNP